MLLAGKIAVITGSANGIGETTARFFAEEGAKVYLIDRDVEKNEALAAAIRDRDQFASAIAGDVRDRAVFLKAVQMAVREFDRVDILINNAGIYPRQAFLSMTEAQWDEMQEINLKSMFNSSQAVLPEMVRRRAGKIVNISSVTFHFGACEPDALCRFERRGDRFHSLIGTRDGTTWDSRQLRHAGSSIGGG